jgi:hypothetical protein
MCNHPLFKALCLHQVNEYTHIHQACRLLLTILPESLEFPSLHDSLIEF